MKRAVGFVVCVTLLSAAGVSAQGKWSAPYDKAKKALKDQQWDMAIQQLQAAIAIDGASGANKRIEGTFSDDYFPQFYLFYAYVKLKQYDKAKAYLNVARPPKPIVPDAPAVLAEYTSATQAATALAANLPQFDTFVKQADAALQAKRYDEAIAAYGNANKLLPDEFKKRSLDSKVADARTGKTGADKAAEDKRIADANIKTAADKAAADKATADKLAADKTAADKAAADARSAALAEFDSLVKSGDTALNAKNYADASTAFTSAKAKLDGEFQKRGLQAKLDRANTELTKMGDQQRTAAEFASLMTSANSLLASRKYDEAIKQYEAARQKSGDEFKRQGLQARLDEATRGKNAAPPSNGGTTLPTGGTTVQAPAGDPAREGLLALFSGDAKRATDLLGKAVGDQRLDQKRRATVRAYLGVAYATLALQSGADVSAGYRTKALEEFRQTKGYQFDKRYVSPSVLKLFDEAAKSGSDH